METRTRRCTTWTTVSPGWWSGCAGRVIVCGIEFLLDSRSAVCRIPRLDALPEGRRGLWLSHLTRVYDGVFVVANGSRVKGLNSSRMGMVTVAASELRVRTLAPTSSLTLLSFLFG